MVNTACQPQMLADRIAEMQVTVEVFQADWDIHYAYSSLLVLVLRITLN